MSTATWSPGCLGAGSDATLVVAPCEVDAPRTGCTATVSLQSPPPSEHQQSPMLGPIVEDFGALCFHAAV